jgi:hypothetical protein
MGRDEFAGLKADIQARGLLEPIILHEGKILDGRGRHKACLAVKVKPEFETYQGTDPLGYVVAKNVARRHLSVSQRAIIAAAVANMNHGGDRRSEDFKPSNDGLKTSVADAAQRLGVSPKTVERARAVLASGNTHLIRLVTAGGLSVSKAAKQVKPPHVTIEDPNESIPDGFDFLFMLEWDYEKAFKDEREDSLAIRTVALIPEFHRVPAERQRKFLALLVETSRRLQCYADCLAEAACASSGNGNGNGRPTPLKPSMEEFLAEFAGGGWESHAGGPGHLPEGLVPEGPRPDRADPAATRKERDRCDAAGPVPERA